MSGDWEIGRLEIGIVGDWVIEPVEITQSPTIPELLPLWRCHNLHIIDDPAQRGQVIMIDFQTEP